MPFPGYRGQTAGQSGRQWHRSLYLWTHSDGEAYYQNFATHIDWTSIAFPLTAATIPNPNLPNTVWVNSSRVWTNDRRAWVHSNPLPWHKWQYTNASKPDEFLNVHTTGATGLFSFLNGNTGQGIIYAPERGPGVWYGWGGGDYAFRIVFQRTLVPV